MLLKILCSSSSGNCYLLESKAEILILECGVPLIKVKKAIDFDLTKIRGVLLSHGHQDHAKYFKQYLDAGIKIYTGEKTIEMLGVKNHNLIPIREKQNYQIGEFLVKAFPLEHDCYNLGFLLHNFETGLICYICDTAYCPFTFKGLNNILIEANYSDEIIDDKLLDGTAKLYVHKRILTHHMALKTTKAFLQANDLSKVANIVLLHLSMDNASINQFRKEVTALTGKQVFIAGPGLNIELNKTGI